MSHEVYVDHPGVMTWFVGYGPTPVIGPCQHECDHWGVGDIAHGPDETRYVLVECGVVGEDEGCAGRCRAWLTGEQSERGGWKTARWLEVDLDRQ